MIEVKNVTKVFEDTKALDNLCLHVKKGTVYGLIGPNGAGKTTIIKHLTGVYKQDAGEVLIDGNNVYENIKLFALGMTYIFSPHIPLPTWQSFTPAYIPIGTGCAMKA